MGQSPPPMTQSGALFYGDNLDVMRRHIDGESVDLVYLDPPFNSNANYNVLFAEQDGSRSASQVKAFGDTWQWDQSAAAAYEEVVEGGGQVSQAMRAFRTLLGPSNMLAYLSMMAPRLAELRRVLKPTGSIYLHCDPTAAHYLKLLMDAVFGPELFQNEIIWHYQTGGASKIRFSRKHDNIFFYTKSKNWEFRGDRIAVPRTEKSIARAQNPKGARIAASDDTKNPNDVLTIQQMNPMARERLGYPTQKPEALLERFVLASSNPGDVVLDPFCGCGTAIAVAERFDRHWIGIDITCLATNLIKNRLIDAFGEGIDFSVTGEPTSTEDAAKLAREDPFQFEVWALGLVGARPAIAKKGADRGIDGRLLFHEKQGGKTRQVVISVKAGKPGVHHVRDLRGVVEREEAEIGLLICMRDPTQPMRQEAASAGVYQSGSEGVGTWGKHPKLQLLTVNELLEGQRIDMPPLTGNLTFRRAPRSEPRRPTTEPLFRNLPDAPDFKKIFPTVPK